MVPDNVRLALEHLIQIADESGVIVAGFAFAKNGAFIINFGNCSDHGDVRLFERLCELRENSVANGTAFKMTVTKAN